jgi:DNA-binding GntR family transcriptional regulator
VTISRTLLREQIKELLLERILNGVYKPGDRLIETQIAQEFGTSQAPVRESLRDLETLRFVEHEPFRGARVRPISREELAEIYPVRAALEEVAARAAALRLQSIEPLEAELEAMLRAADSGDLHEQVQHDVNFHRLIVEASGNETLIGVWRQLRVEARTFITALTTEIDLHKLAEMHRPVLEALAERDPDKAGHALRKHVETFGDLFLKGGSL